MILGIGENREKVSIAKKYAFRLLSTISMTHIVVLISRVMLH
jgi:hypothetical protein